MNEDDRRYLSSTAIIDSDHKEIIAYGREETEGCGDDPLEKKQFMEYVAYHGSFSDIPVDLIVAGMKRAYGEERVRTWINEFERAGGQSRRDFLSEEVLTK